MKPSSRTRSLRSTLLAGAVAASAVLAVTAPGVQAKPKPPKPPKDQSVPVRLLALNDFHGNLEPPTGSSGRMVDEAGNTVDAGGAAYIAAWMDRMSNKNTLKVAQGDLIGATPLISAAYHDEPSVEFLGNVGITVSSVGNHEFDEGYGELKRIMKGGSHPVDGPSPAGKWKGAKYSYIGANVFLEDGTALPNLPGMEILKKIDKKRLSALVRQYGVPALPPIAVRKVNGQEIGFIGAVTETTPTIVTASGIAGLKFGGVVKSAEFGSKLLKELGVDAQVLLVHEGDNVLTGRSPDSCSTTTDPDGSAGAGTEIAAKADPEIDLILSGHSHQAYICTVKDPSGNPRLYSQGGSFGRVISQVDLKISKKTGEIDRSSVTIDNQIVTRDIPAHAKTAAFVQTWKDRVADVANKPVGSITADLTRATTPSGETTLGNLIADAQLAATKGEGGAQIALMNPGGVRADLPYEPDGGVVTYGEAFAVQPFNNLMQVVTLTGAQLDALLEQQWTASRTAVLLPSASLTYTATLANPFGERVSGIRIDGVAVDPAGTYRVAANNFLVGGGDAFSVFTQGTNLWSGPLDLDAFTAYLTANSPVAPPATDRITLG
ncbi:bifunctional UDP-sugar hydrolase/5'-nucleotidase [Actinocorallia sp. A-T 12471]|uniref:bifunctional metallophosphatase/5'-nucleotidase n=1 Tax=Actinocorallia sp. A-T 12471 TaxID=3089813 RepID=UPI0029CD76C5|nr:bifunctional UDP-sugar hydrolase/5'-nucleotidase [Actinocorallia sp. A-T 12471]MDX6738183.1 bifunctional UDP-sugar hydrolase/5'-nucleotidase [Actinocorallia sp. A-T 12471]